MKPSLTYWVYRLTDDGEWVFWMFARGKSAKHVKHSVWWRSKQVPKDRIGAVCEPIPKYNDVQEIFRRHVSILDGEKEGFKC